MNESSGRADATFAGRLRAARAAAALTQEELAERAGLSAKAVGALERGERTRPYPHTVRALADALGLDGAGRSALVAAVPRGPDAAGVDPEPAVALPPAATPTDPLIGREVDVDHVCDLVVAGRRLVTLTGPGGVGKTRLAVEVATRLAPRFAGGSLVVELAALREAHLVVERLAVALGAADAGGSTVATVAAALVRRPVLVVLDNLEQVVDCARDLAALVATAPEVVVVATSRAPLRIRAEHEVVVAPLDVPAGDADPAVVAEASSVRLFVDRCAAAGTALAVTDDLAPVVAEICRRLGGLPLALELAAAASRLLSPAALLARLDDVLDRASLRDLPDRQRTMSAVLDWSHDLLRDDDREVFAALAVFGDPFTLEAATAVTGTEVEASLARLVEQSLVVRGVVRGVDGRGTPRLHLLEPVRQYAMGRLHRSGDPLATSDRHASWFHARAAEATGRLRGPELVSCLDDLAGEHADLRAALLRLVETERRHEAAELLHGSWLYLALRGHAREGRSWAARLDDPLDDAGRAMRDVAAAGLHYAIGDLASLRASARAGMVAAVLAGRHDVAAEAAILGAAGAAFAEDRADSRDLLDRASRWVSGDRDPWRRAHLLIAQAQLALVSADVEGAVEPLAAAEEIARGLDDAFTLATVLNIRATVTELVGDHRASVRLLAESVERSVAGNLGWTLAYALPALAAVAAHLGRDRAAATLFGAAATVAAAADVDTPFPASRELADGGLVVVGDRLGDDDFRSAWEAGRVATRPAVVELARDLSRSAGA